MTDCENDQHASITLYHQPLDSVLEKSEEGYIVLNPEVIPEIVKTREGKEAEPERESESDSGECDDVDSDSGECEEVDSDVAVVDTRREDPHDGEAKDATTSCKRSAMEGREEEKAKRVHFSVCWKWTLRYCVQLHRIDRRFAPSAVRVFLPVCWRPFWATRLFLPLDTCNDKRTPTSINLQPYKMILVRDEAMKEPLAACMSKKNAPVVMEAPVSIIVCSDMGRIGWNGRRRLEAVRFRLWPLRVQGRLEREDENDLRLQ